MSTNITLTLTQWEASTLHRILTEALDAHRVSPTEARMQARLVIEKLEEASLNK